MSYIYNLLDTWNDGATTFTAVKMNVTDTASAAASLLMDLQIGSSSAFAVSKGGSLKLGLNTSGTNVAASNVIISGPQGTGSGAGGSIVFQVAPAGGSGASQNALATFLEATSARAFNLYNTTDVTTNYERGFIKWESNALRIGAEKAGTGTDRPIEFYTAGVKRLEILTNGNVQAPTFVSTGSLYWGSTSLLTNSRLRLSTPADGQVLLQDQAQTSFSLIMLGGTDATFPALKRNGTALETKLANDTAYAPHAMQYLDVTDGVTAPASATDRARIYVDTADGDLKVIFADGIVKTIATDT